MANSPDPQLVEAHNQKVCQAVQAQADGRYGLALALHEEALDLAKQLESRRMMHAAWLNRSSCLLSLNDPEGAQEGLAAIILESDKPRHVSQAAGQLAETLVRQGRYEKAHNYLQTCLEQARLTEDPWQEGWALVLQGHSLVLQGQPEDALEPYRRAIDVHQNLPLDGPTPLEGTLASVIDFLGHAQVLAGQVPAGIGTLHKARQLTIAAGHRRLLGEVEVDLGFAFLLADRPRAGHRHATRALDVALEGKYQELERNSTYLLMELSLRLGRDDEFLSHFERLQALTPGMKLSPDFFRLFDVSDLVTLKELRA
ncbi:MAG: tetratricopeptide repeat protein [Acidobacteriota bacterium]